MLGVIGCANDVRLSEREPGAALRDELRTRLTSTQLSGFTADALDRVLLTSLAEDDPLSAVERLRELAEDEPDANWRLAASELLLDAAIEASPQDATLYLACAHEAQRLLERAIDGDLGLLDSRSAFAASLYRRAVARAVDLSDQLWLTGAGSTETLTGRGGAFELSLVPPARGMRYPAGLFDRLTPTDGIEVAGMRHHFRVRAFGAPVTAVREQAAAEPPRTEPLIPPEGIMAPATVTMRFGEPHANGSIPTAIDLWNTDRVRAVEYRGSMLRLSVDVTAPIATLFARARLVGEGQTGMFDARDRENRIGIYLHEPYDPTKIPVVLVHGLRSSPATWRDMLNDLRSDPVLRERYQFWMFLYPSGLPIPRSASFLRDSLGNARHTLDPYRESRAMDRMVLVGHSMGGLLIKAQLQDSGDVLWDSLHPEPFGDVPMPQDVREHLGTVFFYNADPRIARAIFIATPHGGSSIASSWLGRLGDSLVRLSDDLNAVDRWFDTERDRLPRDNAYQLWQGVPSSIDDLRADSPHLLAYANLPIRDAVPYHTIAGNRNGDGSDGIVTLQSALIDGAASELVIDAGHNAHEHPLAIREVRRILLEHEARAD